MHRLSRTYRQSHAFDILRALKTKPLPGLELAEALGQILPNYLELMKLEAQGFIVKGDDGYGLSEKGRSLLERD